jgi:transcriptional regulator with XRE-family HTH domain
MNIIAFGERLKRFRAQRGLTQLALAQQADVPQSLISDLEAGRREGVTLEMAWRLARELSVSLDYLAGTWDEAAVPGAAPPTAGRGRPRKAAVAPAGATG